jgi:exonuclease III
MIDMPDDAKLKIFSWNVNGIRSFKGKGTLDELIKNGN